MAAIETPFARCRSMRIGPGLVVVMVSGQTTAAPDIVPAPATPAEQQVSFRADRVAIDAELRRLELGGDVRVRAGRCQLTADHLELEQGPQGVVVRGPGRIAFCPCLRPPVSFGFRTATVAPPTDLLVASPTLRLFGVPVLWVPYLWLRSPDQAGLLPATVAYRARDGLLLGSGVHLPWGERDHLGRRKTFDLGLSGYLRGGFETRTKVTTEASTTALRWDHLNGDLLAAEAQGSAQSERLGAATAWSVDALRGPRALRGTPWLEAAAMRYDRARWLLVHGSSTSLWAAGWRADALRGGAFGELGATGPRLSMGMGRALGDWGTLEMEADSVTLAHAELGALSRLGGAARARLDARPSVLMMSLELGGRGQVMITELAEAGVAEAFGRTLLSLPLVRRFGANSDPWVHWVEPFVETAGASSRAQGGWRDFPEGDVMVMLGGVRTAIGRYGARGALSSSVRAGWVGRPDAPSAVSGATLGCSGEYWGVGSHLYALLAQAGAFVSAASARLGRQDGLHVGATFEGREQVEPLPARWLGPDPWRRLGTGWFDRSGWTLGGEVMLPWAAWLSSSFGIVRDLTGEEWLGWRGMTAYRHPCGCLGIVSGLSERIGREGVDGWLSVQLVP